MLPLLPLVCYLVGVVLLRWWFRLRYPCHVSRGFVPGRKHPRSGRPVLFQRKPVWVVPAIVGLKARYADWGGRRIAEEFNRRFAVERGVTVGKTFVYEVMRTQQHEIRFLRRKIKSRPARYVRKNKVWGLDLTTVVDAAGAGHPILAVVEHNTRLCLTLAALPDKRTRTILAAVRAVIRENGRRPAHIRTDNEAIFGPAFAAGLAQLGIGHQKTALACPWQNGRVERFFGTLQWAMGRAVVESFEHLQLGLAEFRFWYNHVRPHQNLGGWTPAEAWAGRGARTHRAKSRRPWSAWGGLLTGTLIRV